MEGLHRIDLRMGFAHIEIDGQRVQLVTEVNKTRRNHLDVWAVDCTTLEKVSENSPNLLPGGQVRKLPEIPYLLLKEPISEMQAKLCCSVYPSDQVGQILELTYITVDELEAGNTGMSSMLGILIPETLNRTAELLDRQKLTVQVQIKTDYAVDKVDISSIAQSILGIMSPVRTGRDIFTCKLQEGGI
jgi:hypothetical protein